QQMSQAALPLLERPVRGVAIADQPAQEGVADQIADLVGGPGADVEDRGGRGQHQPAQAPVLSPRGLVGMDHPALTPSRSSTTGSQATPTSRMQRSSVPTDSGTPNQ